MTDEPCIIDQMEERTKLKYASNCKCGKCQCVPIDVIYRAIATINDLKQYVEAITATEAEKYILELEAALKPFASLTVPEVTQGSIGVYHIPHSQITHAKQVIW